MVCKKAALLLLNSVHVLLCTGACLGSRDTSVKVRCSARALCLSGVLPQEHFPVQLGCPVVTSFSEVTTYLPPQPAKTVH